LPSRRQALLSATSAAGLGASPAGPRASGACIAQGLVRLPARTGARGAAADRCRGTGMSHPAMIFAAGLGTRMGELTRDRPKPLREVLGRPLIDRTLDLAREAGVPRVVVNTHAHAAMLAAHLAKTAPDALISHEPELLETGGGLRRALPLLAADTVFTLNTDV